MKQRKPHFFNELIQVVDGDDTSLLDGESSRPFKRSFSAIYKVDSAALRQWEKDYMNKIKDETFLKQVCNVQLN